MGIKEQLSALMEKYTELQVENKKLKNENANIEFDLNYYQAIFDGSWPQAVPILEDTLKKVKALKK